jgi:hypothetical protein
MRIDFTKLLCYVDCNKRAKMILDVRRELSSALYECSRELPFVALAVKIYNARGEEEYNREELMLILRVAKKVNVILFDSIKLLLQQK